jgi:hypothetical protein
MVKSIGKAELPVYSERVEQQHSVMEGSEASLSRSSLVDAMRHFLAHEDDTDIDIESVNGGAS